MNNFRKGIQKKKKKENEAAIGNEYSLSVFHNQDRKLAVFKCIFSCCTLEAFTINDFVMQSIEKSSTLYRDISFSLILTVNVH